jgi:DNA-binding MarR family transcriptional regulator
MADAGFDDVRRAHNSVFVHLPAEGRRLTDLANAAEMSKQAMGELVDDLVEKRYLRRIADPTDGRARLIVWADRGKHAHEATMRAFATIEEELSEATGEEGLANLRAILLDLLKWVSETGSGDAVT